MEKEKIRLLALQMESVIGEMEINISTVKNLITANVEKYKNADFLFLPEVWTVGWCPKYFQKTAESLDDSSAVKMLSEMARKYNINIITHVLL